MQSPSSNPSVHLGLTPEFALSIPANLRAANRPVRKDSSKRDARDVSPYGFVTARRLIWLGVLANAYFWSGLLIPFSPTSMPELMYMHAFTMMLGVGLALGCAVATVMMVVHQVNVRLFSPELTAAVLHFTVVIAMTTMVVSASLRGWA